MSNAVPNIPRYTFTVINNKTLAVVTPGDLVTSFRGNVDHFRAVTAPAVPGKSGKITVGDPDTGQSYYDSVWGVTVHTHWHCGCISTMGGWNDDRCTNPSAHPLIYP